MRTRKQIESEIAATNEKAAELQAELAAIPKYGVDWKPKDGESFFWIDSTLSVATDVYRVNSAFTRSFIKSGSVYPTREQAERHAPVIGAFMRLLKALDELEACNSLNLNEKSEIVELIGPEAVALLNYNGVKP